MQAICTLRTMDARHRTGVRRGGCTKNYGHHPYKGKNWFVTQSYTKIGSFLHKLDKKQPENLTKGVRPQYICPTIRQHRRCAERVVNTCFRIGSQSSTNRFQQSSTFYQRVFDDLSTIGYAMPPHTKRRGRTSGSRAEERTIGRKDGGRAESVRPIPANDLIKHVRPPFRKPRKILASCLRSKLLLPTIRPLGARPNAV